LGTPLVTECYYQKIGKANFKVISYFILKKTTKKQKNKKTKKQKKQKTKTKKQKLKNLKPNKLKTKLIFFFLKKNDRLF